MRLFQQLAEQLRQVWQGMTLAGRAGFLLLSGLCVAAIVGVGYWAGQPDYRVMFSELSPEDAGAITAALEARGVHYRLTGNGTTVLVPAAQREQIRLDLAVKGLPAGGAKGFEMFDGMGLGMPPGLVELNYVRALQAELARSIMQLEPVAFARVHIVRPQPTPFIREQKPATASVVLKLKPGATLSRGMASGIVALVARSVEGLSPDGITVLDTSGRVLSGPSGSETGAAAASELEYRRDLEGYLATKAENMLTQLLGPGRAVVRITADLNFKRQTETRETYDPDNRVVTTETVTNKKSTGGSTPRGPAGTTSNLGKQPAERTAAATTTQEETVTSEYKVSKSVQTLQEEIGKITRLTVAAMVDLPDPPKDPSQQAPPPLSLKDVEEIVKKAVGFDTARQDQITLTEVTMAGPLADTALDPEWVQLQRYQGIAQIARHASLGVAALVALLLGRMILKRLQSSAAGAGSLRPERAVLLDQLSSEAQRNPERVARMLSHWVEESEQPRKAVA
ncbi:MAG: flagellar M-ring protein FliF [Planctomycetes bacterium]|nr:flagellar M-ring protein FliF [Planctomycetota bacterium]